MTYAVYITEDFEKEFNKLTNDYKKAIQKIFLQIKENPYVGDWLRYKFLREKRVKEKRIYYLVYDDLKSVLIVSSGGKKAQKETINEIVKFLPEFRDYLKSILKQENS